MGCFSWLCCVCNGQILGPGYFSFDCAACDETTPGTVPATLLMPDGEHVTGEYDNYGRFGYPEGKDPWLSGMDELALDAYGWLARANAPEKTDTMKPFMDAELADPDFWEMTRENTLDDEERGIGIDLFFKKNKHGNRVPLKYPIKAAHSSCLSPSAWQTSYEDHKASESDPDQGWQRMQEAGDYEFCEECDPHDWLEENT